MHSFIGHLCVLVAIVCASMGSVVGFVGGWRQDLGASVWVRRAVYGFALAMFVANGVMVMALLVHDFSVAYVAQVGSLTTPTWVTVVSLWSALEGSILFWGAILGAYLMAFARVMKGRHGVEVLYAQAVMLSVALFFAMLIAGPADPFAVVANPPADGPGPNVLLQNHILMVIHPPMLYLGYVGMVVPFGVALAALLRGEMSSGWVQVLRFWTLIPWAFLSVGIILGAWWAYEVLGWGGYWAWDPVENASFLPWLVATAFLHSLMVQQRRRMLKVWTLTLIISAFLLTILGTFMTRSGVFNSVHSFTQSDIGPLFLVFLGFVSCVSLVLLAVRGAMLEDNVKFRSLWSREGAFVLNNLVFVVLTFTVLLGTVFPLIVEAIEGTKMSVGEPYYNQMAVPIGLVLVFLMGVGPVLPWGQGDVGAVVRDLSWPLGFGALCSFLVAQWVPSSPMALVSFGLCGFAGWVTLRQLFGPIWQRRRRHPEAGLWSALGVELRGNRRRVGGYVVHLGVLLVVVSITASRSYAVERQMSFLPGEQATMGGYTFEFVGPRMVHEVNKVSVQADFQVSDGQGGQELFSPRLNYYHTQREPIGTPHVRTKGGVDIYLSLLSLEDKEKRAVVKAYVFPGVSGLWWSILFFVGGSLLAMWPKGSRAGQVVKGGGGAEFSGAEGVSL